MKNQPINLKNIRITDPFWHGKMELVRKEVIPYQWAALNDRIADAQPSYAIRNLRTAIEIKETGVSADVYHGPVYQDSDLFKWIEAAAYSLIDHPDEKLEALCDGVVDLIVRAQADDGYMNTYYLVNGRENEFSLLWYNHELYCFGHMTEAAVAYANATGKEKFLHAAERYADYIASKIGPEEGKKHGYPGHEGAELALVKLYELTGKKSYLALAKYFIDERGRAPIYFLSEDPAKLQKKHHYPAPFGNLQAHRPVREQTEAVGHAVRAVYLYSGMADVARHTQDAELLSVCETLFEDIAQRKLYITGGIGSAAAGEAFTQSYDLPNDTAYCESCASIGLAFFARRMIENHPRAVYGDILEKALYNVMLAGIALDGKSFFYVNPLESDPLASRRDPGKRHVKAVRQKWFSTSCCPPNIARTIESIGAYIYTESDDTLFTNLYIGSRFEKRLGASFCAVTQEVERRSDLWDVKLRVDGGKGLVLALRKPEWCRSVTYHCQGCAYLREEDGYLYFTVQENTGSVALHLPLHVRFMEANDLVKADYGKIAVQYGPTVYCIEGADNGTELHELAVRPGAPFRLEPLEIGGERDVKIVVAGLRTRHTGTGLYRELTDAVTQETELTFIPYRLWNNRGENEMRVWVGRG